MQKTTVADSKETVKAALSNTVANGIVMLFALLMIPITTRVLSTEDLGIATNFFSFRNICLNVFTLATYTALNKGMLEFKDEKKEFLSSLLVFNFLVIGILMLVYIPFEGLLQGIFGYPKIFAYMVFGSVFLWMAYNLGTGYLLFHNKYKPMFAINMCIGPVSQILAIFLIVHFSTNKYMGRVIGIDGFYWVIGLAFAVWIFLTAKTKINRSHLQFALGMTVPLVPHLLAQTLLSQSDILMITHYAGADKTGIYSMAYTISMVLYSVLIQIMNVWSPWVYRRMEENDLDSIYKNSKLLYFLGLILVIGLMMISPEAVTWFLAPEYRESMYLIPILVVGMYFLFLYTFFYDVEYFHKKTGYIAIASFVAAILNLVLNRICIPKFGYIAAGYTTAIGYFALVVLHMIFMRKVDKRKIYNVRLMFLVSVFVLIFAVLMYVLIEHPVLRYGLGCISIFVILLIFRKGLLSLLSLFGKKKENEAEE